MKAVVADNGYGDCCVQLVCGERADHLCDAAGRAEADVIVAAINGILGWQSGRSRLGLNDAARALRQYGEQVFGAKAGRD